MGKRTVWAIIIVILVAVLATGTVLFVKRNAKPGKYDEFAKCLKDKGATFYGAFWCPHCQNQKKLFGTSKKYIPYVECSTPDGKGQTDTCKAKKVSGYPTWVFADGTTQEGEMTFDQLAQKTGCTLPQ